MKNGKVIITKPPKPSTTVFTRRSSKKKVDKEGGDVIFRKPPPTFQDQLTELQDGAGVTNFKALKYEIGTEEEPKQIEDLVMDKMGKWKYSPDQISSHIPSILMDKIRPRWDFAMQTTRDIYGKNLRHFVPSITDTEIKESIKKNEENLTLKFNTCLILIKDIEHVVKNATNTWKNIYRLHKPSDFLVDVKDDDEEEKEKDEE